MPSKIALVTGAGSGIGRAVSLALQSAGYRVVLAGRRAAALAETAQQGLPTGLPMLPVPADVGNPDDVRRLFATTSQACGRLDVLFNNAGMSAPAIPMEDLSYEQWSAVVAVNLTGAFLCAQEAIKLMKAQDPRGGRIINNGSLSAHAPRPNSAPYTATKHAITGLTRCLSLDGRPYDIACGQIDIGNAATEMTARMASGVRQARGDILPEPCMDVRHVADAVLYMAQLPLDANVQFMTVMATKMPFVGRGVTAARPLNFLLSLAVAMTVDEIRELINLATETGIAELEVQRGDNRVRIRRSIGGHQEFVWAPQVAQSRTEAPVVATTTPVGAAPPPAPAEPKGPGSDPNLILVRSPIVGTFYEGSGPGGPPFVRVGERVQPGKVLCIIESMKLMNEIEAEVSGAIESKLVMNGQPVEYGEALFAIRPN